MATHQQYHSHRPPVPPFRRPLGPASVSVSAPLFSRRRGARVPLASFGQPPSPHPLLPKKRAAAAGLGEGDGEVVVNEEPGVDNLGEKHQEYVATVGAAIPARAGPAGDPVFFLLTAVAVMTSLAFTSMVAVAIPAMLFLSAIVS
ncbi:hypothetical protein QOZ80_UnG0724790 [Eleusine coracana subsp. coracana]|uniref:Uncharacterized protein n=1 Tax=Eleusine coracana subsp. coracana TaxID=191504 RepID=A0AAV9FY15_ELECO|nr:hypothetical protein QOZ80_UnG0724790 [Eleusine coracana subsp. coracana]